VITVVTKSVDDTRAMGAEVAALTSPGDLLVLAGDLGTGKTAFTQGLARGLGIEEPVTSPAFILVRTYEGRAPLNHIDVYRLDYIQELVDLGIAELIDAGGITVVEWGDVVLPALPSDFLEVRFDYGEADDDREVEFDAVGASWAPRMAALRAAVGRWSAEA
jgi:tRNA threonylcarbamoyladenosine biosynthesis protein TsaE